MEPKVRMTKEDAVAFLKDIAKSIEMERAIDFRRLYKKEEHKQLMADAYVQALEMAIDALECK